MPRLIVTADVHGSYSTWITVCGLLGPDDSLAVAGDLFDTRYGNPANPDFQPEMIREHLADLTNSVYLVYGNCDVPAFFPGQADQLRFSFQDRKILMLHGHTRLPEMDDSVDIIVYGHTHRAALDSQDNRIFFNPGSLARPKDGHYTYGVMEKDSLSILDIRTGRPIATRSLDPS